MSTNLPNGTAMIPFQISPDADARTDLRGGTRRRRGALQGPHLDDLATFSPGLDCSSARALGNRRNTRFKSRPRHRLVRSLAWKVASCVHLLVLIALLYALPSALAASVTQAEARIDGGPPVPMVLTGTTTNVAFQEADFAITLPTTNLSIGSHLLETRFQADNGVWSAWRSRWFRVSGNPTLTAAEWYLDNDPGPGNGFPIPLPADGAWDGAEETIRAGATLPPGVATGRHDLFIRTRDSDGNWGTPNRTTFYVADPLRIVAAEWTTNALAEPGTGIPLTATDGLLDEAEEDLVAAAPAEILGPPGTPQTLYVRVKDNLGRWSTRTGYQWDETAGIWNFDPDLGWGEARIRGVMMVEGPVDPLAVTLRDQPVGRRVGLRESVSLHVTALAQLPLTYQWLLNGQPLRDQTSPTLTIGSMSIPDGGAYAVSVSNGEITLTSEPAVLEVALDPLPLTDRFADRTVVTTASSVGATNNLAATTNEPGEPRHADKRGGKSMWMTWRAPQTGRATFATTGSTFDTLLAVYTGNAVNALTEVVSDEDSGGFLTSRVVFNAVAGTDYQIAVAGFAEAAGIIVLSWDLDPAKPPLPRIVSAPEDRVVPVGGQTDFVVLAEGDGLVFQWLFNGVELPGETASLLRRTAVVPPMAGVYSVRVTNAAGESRETIAALLEVVSLPTAVVSADKIEDLFPEDAASAPALQAPGGSAWTSIPAGVTDVRDTNNRGAGRSPQDPVILGELGGASLWMRLRVVQNGLMHLSTEGSEIPAVVGVYTNRSGLSELALGVPERGRNHGEVTIPAHAGVDYLVMVDGVAGARGRIRLTTSLPAVEAEPWRARPQWVGSRFMVRQAVRPGWYELQSGEDLLQLNSVLSTNVSGGMFEYTDPQPLSPNARFYHLKRIR